MAFTFTVEDGTIVTGANSYVTVQEADDYLAQNIHIAATWDALETSDKQALLSWATRYLDQRATWNGTTTTQSTGGTTPQPLRWPRACVRDVDRLLIDTDVIPSQLKQATIEMARYLIDADRSIERPQDGLEELKVDVITMIFKADYTLPKVPSEINLIIRGLGTIGNGTLGFGKIIKA